MKKPKIKNLSSYQKKKLTIERLNKELYQLRRDIVKFVDNPNDKELLQYFQCMAMEMKLGAMVPKHSVLAWLKALRGKKVNQSKFSFYEHPSQ